MSANPLETYNELLPLDLISELKLKKSKELSKISHWSEFKKKLQNFIFPPPQSVELQIDDTVQFTTDPTWQKNNLANTSELIHSLFPWRKGPFHYLGVDIDAEWRSEKKWDRLLPHLPQFDNKLILDVGANNGYYMYRMLAHNPKFILGLDPSSRGFYQYELFRQTLGSENPLQKKLHFELFGIEDLHLFPNFFNITFCLGVIYHRRDPYSACKLLYDSLAKSGVLFIESLVIPGEEEHTLCPSGRYAKMRNVWFVPTVKCLKIWLEKAGFKDIELLDLTTTTSEEQRQTELAPYESLSDFLDPQDSSKTIEGYPAPVRAIVKATKR